MGIRNRDEGRNESLEVMRFGVICYQLGFTFKGDGFGPPFTVIYDEETTEL